MTPELLPSIQSKEAIYPVELDHEAMKQAVVDHWEALQVDTSRDELTEGGQSIEELKRLEDFEAFIRTLPSVEIPCFHKFADGIYIRGIRAPKDSVLIGYEHRCECWNIMMFGKVMTIFNGVVRDFTGPCMVKSGAHTRKASIVVEDMIWATVHPNPDNETDILKLEERLLVKDKTYRLQSSE